MDERHRLREQIHRLTAFPDKTTQDSGASVGPGHGYSVVKEQAAQAADATVDHGERAASPQELSPVPDVKHSPSRSAGRAKSTSVGGTESRTGSAGVDPSPADVMDSEALRKEYEEFRSCFLELAQIVPNSTTAREVTTNIAGVIDQQRRRIESLETELKKKSVAFQTAKKALHDNKEVMEEMKRHADASQALGTRLRGQEKESERLKKVLAKSKQDWDAQREDLEKKNQALEAELESTRRSFAEVRKELLEGRELLVSLMAPSHSPSQRSDA